MDVAKMVKYLQTVAAAGRTPFKSLVTGNYLNRPGIRDVHQELELFGEYLVSVVAVIVGHKG